MGNMCLFIKSYWRTVKRKNPARAAKCLKDNNYKASILRENVLLYLSLNVMIQHIPAFLPGKRLYRLQEGNK